MSESSGSSRRGKSSGRSSDISRNDINPYGGDNRGRTE
jgi:hypothetical protein